MFAGYEESVLMTPTTSKHIADLLLEIEAVKFNVKHGFTWASGIKSPIYCDNRIINSKVPIRDQILGDLVKFVHVNHPETEIIAAVASGGMFMGTLIADRLKMPFIYVRDAPKEHGLMKQVEGFYEPGKRVVLIEDHISTGGSSMKAIRALREVGLNVISLLSIMTYKFDVAEKLFNENNVNHSSLCDLDTILDVAQNKGILSPSNANAILEFRQSPKTWQPQE